MKKFFLKHREIIMYLIFGLLTTVVGWVVYFVVLFGGKAVAGIPSEQTTGGGYFAVYSLAQIVQWLAAVLFSFVTSRKWVFTDGDKGIHWLPQLGMFAACRLATFGLDYVATYFGGMLLSSAFPSMNNIELFGRAVNGNELIAKIVAATLVMTGNYVFSKLLVFKKKK